MCHESMMFKDSTGSVTVHPFEKEDHKTITDPSKSHLRYKKLRRELLCLMGIENPIPIKIIYLLKC